MTYNVFSGTLYLTQPIQFLLDYCHVLPQYTHSADDHDLRLSLPFIHRIGHDSISVVDCGFTDYSVKCVFVHMSNRLHQHVHVHIPD